MLKNRKHGYGKMATSITALRQLLSALIICIGFVSTAGAANEGLTISPVTEVAAERVQATLQNARVKIEFISAKRGGQESVVPRIHLRSGQGWKPVPMDASAESYQVMAATDDVLFNLPRQQYHPTWDVPGEENGTSEIWKAGVSHEAIAQAAQQIDSQRVRLFFNDLDVGVLEAEWLLKPEEITPRVHLRFSPKEYGQYSLGYFLFKQSAIENVQEVLVPMFVDQKRFPKEETVTYLQGQAPTPLSLMETEDMVWSVIGEPDTMPFTFPDPHDSEYGFQIRGPSGLVHPSIFGPLIGLSDSRLKAGETLNFALRVLVEEGDWYSGYRIVADEVFGFRDYRKNIDTSLTGAMLNMVDLFKDDEYVGWWEETKAYKQIESKDSATQASPITGLSLYRLTGDREIYEKRGRPMLEYVLSRGGPHFALFEEARLNSRMDGPVGIYGSTVYGGLWEMTNRRTPALAEVALPGAGPRFLAGYDSMEPDTHFPRFSEWLGRYLVSGDQTSLDEAKAEADRYIAASIDTPSEEPRPLRDFFLMQYTPAWESLLALYEATGEERYLEAAAKGARRVMPGLWTQPMPPEGKVTIHRGGKVRGDKMSLILYRGGRKYRLGFPLAKDSTPEKQIEAWKVSSAGLGFEQPTTYTYPNNGGRMIFQAPWTPWFLRLAHYTGDPDFATYARNAVVGRWSNYPGYYNTTFTDVMMNPDFPYKGPDLSFIYYHHIPVHISWTMDYLVSDAFLLSDGKISFPGLRQYGYAFFDYRMYGHAPGSVMGEKDVWIWLKRGLVELDNSQLNYLTAHNGESFFVIMMNQNREEESAELVFDPAVIGGSQGGPFRSMRELTGDGRELPLTANSAKISVPGRGLRVFAIDGLDISIPAHQQYAETEAASQPGYVTVDLEGGSQVKAAALQIEPGWWDAFIWSDASYGDFKEMTVYWDSGSQSGSKSKSSYPYEFSIPVYDGQRELSFVIEGTTKSGETFRTEERRIGVAE